MALPLASGGSFPVQPLGRNQRFGYVDQTAIGTPPAGNLLGLQEVRVLDFQTAETKERKDQIDKRSSPSLYTRFDGNRGGTWKMTGYLKPSGVVATAPDIGGILDAAGFSETVTPATRVRYAPDSTITPLLLVNDIESYGEYAHDAIVSRVNFLVSGSDACKIEIEGIHSHKALITRTQLNGAEAAGQTVLTVDDGRKVEVDSYAQVTGDSGGGDAGYRVTAVSGNNITVSPALAVGGADDAQVGPIFTPSSTAGNVIDGNSGSLLIGGAITALIMEGNIAIEASLQDTRDNAFNAGKYDDVFYVNRRVTGQVKCKLNRTNDLLALHGRGNVQTALVLTLGTTAGSIVTITLPYVEWNPIDSIDIPEENAIEINATFVALASAGNDEIQIDFT